MSFQGTKSIFYIKHPSRRLKDDVGKKIYKILLMARPSIPTLKLKVSKRLKKNHYKSTYH